MACSLSITSVTGLSVGGVTNAIRVTGTLTGDCTPVIFSPTIKFDVVVDVDCGTGPSSASTLSSAGNWSVDVPASCNCNKPIRVTAHCASNPDCRDAFSGALQCEEQGACPTGTIAVSVDGCNDDGTRNVTLAVNITSVPPGSVGQWDFADGTFILATPIAGPGVYTEPHRYTPPGPSNPVQFIWILPPNCPPFTAVVPGLQSCPINCPQIVTVTASPPGECNNVGSRVVHLNASLSGGPAQSYHWEFGDGTDVTIPVAMGPAVDHDYSAPADTTYTAIFTVTGFNGACVDSGTVTIDIESCGATPPPPPPSNGEGGGCKGLRWAGVIAAILAALALYICQCVPAAGAAFCFLAAGFALLSAVLLGIWFLWCPKPCGAGLLISWQIALGAGIGALYFAPCCPFLWIIGAGLIAAAIAGLIAWIKRCNKTRCQVLAELAIVITVVIVPILGWIAGIPFLGACLNPIVAAAVSTLSAGVAVGLALCASHADPPEEATT